MLRRLCLSVALVAFAAPLAANAQSVIPDHVNIHNGFIEVRNEVVLKNGATSGGTPLLLTYGGGTIERSQTTPGGTTFLNVCCIAAGSLYKVHYGGRANVEATVRPQLCNVRGIPFGYAVVVFTGSITYDSKTHGFDVQIEPHVPPVSCPVAR
ncbi:MAG TPA: hypothetical protein VIG46_12650 [Candidatus Baltobacteraceae bacterium]